MTKRMLALVLIFCLILPVLPAEVFAEEPFDDDMVIVAEGPCGDNARFTLRNGGLLTISGTGDTVDESDERFRLWEQDYGKNKITEVVVESGITSLAAGMFAVSIRLEKVTLPEGLESIGDRCFSSCTSLKSVEIPESVVHIGDRAFGNCYSLKELTLPKNLVKLGSFALNKTALEQLEIPNSQMKIPEGLCESCFNLTSVTLPEEVTEIGARAFAECARLEQIELPETLTTIKEEAFYQTSLQEIAIPETVTSIENRAFYHALSLKKVMVHNPEIELGEEVWGECPNVTIACKADTYLYFAAEVSGIPVEIIPEDYTGPKYNVTISSTGYGTAEVNTTEARPGRYVKVTVNFDDPLLVAGVVVMPEKQITEQIEMINLSDTELLFKMPECNVQVGVAIEDLSPFEDVSYGKYYYEPVLWAYVNEITTGKTETQFAPNDPCIRKQVVTFLWRACGCPEPRSMENPFTDVAPGSFYEKPILWAYHAGITTGKTSTTFAPDDPCTRDQIVTFLWRTFGCPEPQSMDNPFTDVGVGSFFEKPILWAYYEGITTGKTATTFEPKATCTRCQIVTFLYRSIVEE